MYCPECERKAVGVKSKTNWANVLIFSIFTLGLYFLYYLVYASWKPENKCPICGTTMVKPEDMVKKVEKEIKDSEKQAEFEENKTKYGETVASNLDKLNTLRDKKLISEETYLKKKDEIMA